MKKTFQACLNGSMQELVRDTVDLLQVNVGYVCNLQCNHCHLQAGPNRKEVMSRAVIDDCLRFVRSAGAIDVDITGGAPEANPDLPYFITSLRKLTNVKRILVRSNLAILAEKQCEHLPAFFAENDVEIVASMPCYLEENVTAQRGQGVYSANIAVLAKLNQLGYGIKPDGLRLNLVYNPGGAFLPAAQTELEPAYKEHLQKTFGIRFNSLFTIANMALGRFRTCLEQHGLLDGYETLLAESFNQDNLAKVMCRNQISVDWQGRLFDCDFNQAVGQAAATRENIGTASVADLLGLPIVCGDHCFACTAGAGSSCQGSL